MPRSLWLAVVLATTSLPAADPPTAKMPKVEVIGLNIKRALSDEKEELEGVYFPGTGVDLIVSLPGRHIVCLDGDKSKLASFVDDLGSDLSKAQPGRKAGGSSIPSALEQVSRDGRRCRVTLRAASVPAKGAKSITMTGNLVLKCGSDEQVVQTANVDLPGPSEKVKVGAYTLSGGVKAFDGDVMLSFATDTPNVKSIVFFGPDSKELKPLWGNFTRRPGQFEGGSYFQFITVPKPEGKVTIRITYYKKIEDVSVPIELKVGLGL